MVADLGDVEKKHAPAVRVEMINGLPKIINQFGLGSSGVLAISASKHSKCTVTPALEVKLLVSSQGFLQTEQFLITIHTRHRTPNPATKKPHQLNQSQWGAPQEATGSCGVVVPVVPNPRHGKLLALLGVTRGKLVNPDTKKPAAEYPTAGVLRPRNAHLSCVQDIGESV